MTKKKQMLSGSILVVLVLLVFAAFYRQRLVPAEPISETAFKLNTVVKVTIYDSDDRSLLTEVFGLCDKYEALFSRTKESSEIYRLNHGMLPEEDGFFALSPETAELVSKGLEYSRLSDGAFDIAIAPVSSLWDFTSDEKIVPEKDALTKALPLIDYRDVELDQNRIRFAKKGMELDLGAIAKGYIADRMKDFLVGKGVKSAIIDLGGNILCIGNKPDNTPFRIGVQKPFANRSETVSAVSISDSSVVSSGIYERYFEKDGRFYHHLLNPATGYPYDNGLVSVTILSEQSVDGDGLSTSCFALGLKKGMELIERLPDVEAVFITADEELHYSSHFPK